MSPSLCVEQHVEAPPPVHLNENEKLRCRLYYGGSLQQVRMWHAWCIAGAGSVRSPWKLPRRPVLRASMNANINAAERPCRRCGMVPYDLCLACCASFWVLVPCGAKRLVEAYYVMLSRVLLLTHNVFRRVLS